MIIMDKLEKMEKLNQAKSKQITELEKEIEELNNKIIGLEHELDFSNARHEKLYACNLTLQGKNEALTEVIMIITGHERYYDESKLTIPRQSTEDID